MRKEKNKEMVITYNKMNIFLPEESMIKCINPEKRKSGVSFLSLCTWGDLAEAQNRIKGFSASCENPSHNVLPLEHYRTNDSLGT